MVLGLALIILGAITMIIIPREVEFKEVKVISTFGGIREILINRIYRVGFIVGIGLILLGLFASLLALSIPLIRKYKIFFE